MRLVNPGFFFRDLAAGFDRGFNNPQDLHVLPTAGNLLGVKAEFVLALDNGAPIKQHLYRRDIVDRAGENERGITGVTRFIDKRASLEKQLHEF